VYATPLYRQAALEARHGVRIATDLAPAMPWTDAEEYHQDFYGKSKAKRSWMNPQ
jgi:peptide methionine sulfoxide reductase MsrA